MHPSVDVYASRSHYADHIRPVYEALGDLKGTWLEEPEEGDSPVIVASMIDHHRMRSVERRVIVMEHGIGQSYSNDNHGYPGGRNRAAELFLTPNHHSADRWAAAYPDARVEVVGSPRLDCLRSRVPDGQTTVAVTFHWDCQVAPESRSALSHYKAALPDLAGRFHVIGHGHPRARLRRMWEKMGVEYVPDFQDVLSRADLLVADNTSALYEFAASGRPVVVLDAPWYRPSKHHGLRFWDAADVGIRISGPGALAVMVEAALADPEEARARREAALDMVYAHRNGATARAVDAVRGFLC